MTPAPALSVLVIAGPTASGKSRLAFDVAEAFDGTVINADSMQVYRELRVLTARPSPVDEARVPHRLFGVLPVTEACSAGRWLAMATAEIGSAHARGRLPVVVGGTGLYLKALIEGLSPVPPIPDGISRRVRRLHARVGGKALQSALAKADPDAAARLPPGDGQRLMRSMEVVRATGRTLDEWHRIAREADGRQRPAPGRFAILLLMPPRDAIYAASDARLRAMVEAGALDEVRALDSLPDAVAPPAAKALGLREFARHLRGETSLEEALDQAKRATRNLAKRQMTWFRHQLNADKVVGAQYSESLRPEIFSFVRRFLLTKGS